MSEATADTSQVFADWLAHSFGIAQGPPVPNGTPEPDLSPRRPRPDYSQGSGAQPQPPSPEADRARWVESMRDLIHRPPNPGGWIFPPDFRHTY